MCSVTRIGIDRTARMSIYNVQGLGTSARGSHIYYVHIVIFQKHRLPILQYIEFRDVSLDLIH